VAAVVWLAGSGLELPQPASSTAPTNRLAAPGKADRADSQPEARLNCEFKLP
jgi:hypothetical protein